VELLCSLTVLPGEPGAELPSAVAISQDVTKQRGEERQALNDALTGLPNRRYLLRYLATLVGRAQPHDEVVAVLFLDLDGFKRVNDTMGHAAGDEVLRVVAARFIEALRRDDIVARLGGDEFVAVCRSVTDREEAMKIAHRLIASAGQPIPIGDDHAQVIPSIGIVILGDEPGYLEAELSPMDILRRADAAMYVAKRSKRGPVIAD
jgi:diguanylate cyclase (GGDEF)-like protein